MVTAEYVSEERRIGQVNTMRNGLLGTITGTIKNLYYVTLETGTVKVLTYESFLRGNLEMPIGEVVHNKNFHYGSGLVHEEAECYNGEKVKVSSRGFCSYDIEYPDGNTLVGVSEMALDTYLRSSSDTFRKRSENVRDYINAHKGWLKAHDGSLYRLTGRFKNIRNIEVEFEDGVTSYENVIQRKKMEHPYLRGKSNLDFKIERLVYQDGEYLCICNNGVICTLSEIKRRIEYGC